MHWPPFLSWLSFEHAVEHVATIKRLLDDRDGMAHNPFWFVYTKCQNEITPYARYIQALETFDFEEEDAELTRKTCQTTRTKFQTYCSVKRSTLH
jgi:hypothetical protein